MSSRLLIKNDDGKWWEIDLLQSGDSPITTTHRRSDMKELGKPRSSFAGNIVLVGSPRTLRALNYGHRLDQDAGSTKIGAKFDALYLEDGVDVLEGPAVLEIQEITTSNEVVLFQCYLTGGRYRWLQDIQDIDYKDCDLGIHTFSYANVTATWDKDTNGRFIHGVYLPIHYGTWIQPPATVQMVEIEFSPYIKSIIEKAHEAVGWTVSGGAWWEDICGSLIMPHVGNLVKGNTGDKDGVRPKTVNIRREFRRVNGEGVPTCLDGGSLNPERLRRFEIVPGSEINCTTTMLSDTRGLVRCTPPDNEYVGAASFQYRIYCDPDGLAGGGAETLLGVYTLDLNFEDPFISTDYNKVVDAEMSVPILGEQLYDDGDELRLPSDFYETHAVQRGTVQNIDENTKPAPPFSPSKQYGLDQDRAYTIPFDGLYSVWLNLQTIRSDAASVWHIRIISDQRGILAFATINASTYDNIVLQDQFLNDGEILTFTVVRVSGTGTLTLINKDSDPGALPEDIPTVYPAFRLECAPKISITPAADGNFYDAFPQDYQVVASHAYKNFNVLDMMAGLQHAFNLEFIPDNEQRVLYIYKETETTNTELPPVDISRFIREGALIKEKVPPANNRGSISIQEDGTICTDVRFRWLPDQNDGYVTYYQDVSGDQYLHGDRVPKNECVVESENPFFSPTALQLSYMGINPEEVDGFSPSYPGDLPDIKQYMMWLLTMQPDQEEPDFYDLSIEIIKDPDSFSWDAVEDDELWEGRVTHDYNHRIAYFHGLVNPVLDNDYFDEWFLLGTFAQVGFNLRYWDGSTYVENNFITSALPYAYMIDLWNEDPLAPSLSFKKERYGNPAYFTTEFVKANVNLFQTISRTVSKNLRAESWVNTLRRFSGGRYFEVPVGLTLPDLQGLLSFDRRKYFTHPELGTGIFYLDAIRNFNQQTGTATLELWQEEPTCETGTCLPGLSSFDTDFTSTKHPVLSEVSFGMTIDNTLDDFITIVDTPFTIYNGYTGATIAAGTIDGSVLLSTGIQSFGAVTVAGAGFPTSVYGEPNFKVNIKGSIQYYNKEGELCGYPFCYEYEAIIDDTSETVVFTSFDADCRVPPPMYDSFTCFETASGLGSFPNRTKSELPLSDLEAVFDTARKWRLDEISINGSPILQKYWGLTSDWWQNSLGNIGYIQSVNDGTYATAPVSSANNTENFFVWFNSLFAYASLDPQGFPVEFESPIYFRPAGDRILAYASSEFPGNVILKLSKFTDLVDSDPAFQYELKFNTAGGSGLMQVKNGVTGVTEIAYTISSCSPLPEPDLATQYCQLYGKGLLGGVGATKFTDLTAITGYAAGRLKYIVEHFEVDLGGNQAGAESMDIGTGGATLGPGTYQGVALPVDVINFFNQLSYVHPTAFRFTDGGLFYEHNDNKAYRIAIREEIYEQDQVTLSSTWRYVLDTQTGFFAGDATVVTTAWFGSPLLSNTCTDMISLENAPPTVSNVQIGGTPTLAQTLNIASYTYNDIEGDLEDTSDPNRVEWFAYPTLGDAQANTNATSLGTGMTFMLSVTEVGSWIRAAYTPSALTGGLTGVATLSDNILGPVLYNNQLIAFTTDEEIFSANITSSFNQKVVVDWGDGSAEEVYTFLAGVSQAISHNYTGVADRSVVAYGEPVYLDAFNPGDLNKTIKGTLSIAANEGLRILDVAGSSDLTALSLSSSSSPWIRLDISGTGITSLNWAAEYDFLPTTIRLFDSSITAFTMGGHTQDVAAFEAYPTAGITSLVFNGISTMSGIFDIGGGSISTLNMPPASSAPFSLVRVKDDDTITTLDFSWISHTVTDFCVEDVTALTTLTSPQAAINGAFKVTGNSALSTLTPPTVASTVSEFTVTGSAVNALDASTFTVNGPLDISSNSSLTSFIPPAGGALTDITVGGTVGYVDFTDCTLTGAADVDWTNQALSAADVNQFLVDLVAMATGVTGATGTIDLTGTNAGPDTFSGGLDGLAAITTLEGQGYIVLRNEPTVFNVEYTTTAAGMHSFDLRSTSISSIYVDWDDGTTEFLSLDGTLQTFSHTYSGAGTRTVRVNIDPSLIDELYFNNSELSGNPVLNSEMPNLRELHIENQALSGIFTCPRSDALERLWLNGSDHTSVRFTAGTVGSSLSVQMNEADSLSGSVLDTTNLSGTFLFFSANTSAASGLTLDLGTVVGVNMQVSLVNSDFTSLNLSNTTGTMTRLLANGSSLAGPIVIGAELTGNCLFRLQSVSGITEVDFVGNTASPPRAQEWRVQGTGLSGIQDMSDISFDDGLVVSWASTNVTQINLGTTLSGAIRSFNVSNSDLSAWQDFGNYSVADNCALIFSLLGWSAAIVNEALHDLDPVGGGAQRLADTASGGSIEIDGNTAPDGASGGYDGVTAAANILAAGYILTTD